MTKAEIIAEVEKRLGLLDEKAKRPVEMAMELMERLPATEPEPQWQGENPPFSKMAELTKEERLSIMDELATANHDWLE